MRPTTYGCAVCGFKTTDPEQAPDAFVHTEDEIRRFWRHGEQHGARVRHTTTLQPTLPLEIA